jgi:exodeoxyribonuclease VII large subunit
VAQVPFDFKRKSPAPEPQKPFVWSVTGLQRRVRGDLERGFGNVLVGGEISSLSLHGVSGHAYFTLKDADAQLRCVMWRDQVQRLLFPLENGHEVIVRGRLTVFEKSGQLQMTVQTVDRQGDGALEEAYRLLAEKLRREGLTAPERKRPLPLLPRTVGIVTSKNGAALRDVLKTALRRDPKAHLILAAASVQGSDASHDIVRALQKLDACGACDVILLVRGGGSREDLWAFNNEGVARAIVSCKVPVVTGIGHETDTSIADLVADVACSTPTAAAERAIPVRADIERAFRAMTGRLDHALRANIHASGARLHRLERALGAHDPKAEIRRRGQILDELTTRAERSLRVTLSKETSRHTRLVRRLARVEPRSRIIAAKSRLALFEAKLDHEMTREISRSKQRFELLCSRLESLSPVAVLARGYAIVRTESGALVRRASEVTVDDRLRIRVAEGEIRARVEDEKP